MSDTTDTGSKENVAYKLLRDIAGTTDIPRNYGGDFKEWYLDLYGDCLRATKGTRGVSHFPSDQAGR